MPSRRQEGKPTIEQRLEAITQTLEIVAGMQLAIEKEQAITSKNLAITAKNLSHLTALSKIVMTSHEARIKSLEKGGKR
jgi:hypothetical protein